MISLVGTETSTGIRIYGTVNFTYTLKKTDYRTIDRKVQTGSYVELTGFTEGQSAKIEVRDERNALQEIVAVTVNANQKYTHTLPVIYYPLTSQTYIRNEIIEVKVNALQTDTVSCTIGGNAVTLTYDSVSSLWKGQYSSNNVTGKVSVSVIVNGTSYTKNIYAYNVSNPKLKWAFQILSWLQDATDDWTGTSPGKRVRERFMVNNETWGSPTWGGGTPAGIWYRPDCNIETVLTYFYAWKHTGNQAFYDAGRSMYNSIKALQQADGSWYFFQNGDGTYDTGRWADDNSEVAQGLIRLAEIDTVNKDDYIQRAVKTMDCWLPYQRSTDGLFPTIIGKPEHSLVYSCHVYMALATVYPHATNKSGYKTAIEKGLNNITTAIDANGKALSGSMGDQANYLRAVIYAEKYAGADSANLSQWKADRLKMMSYLENNKIHSTGAIMGHDDPNKPNTIYYIDHVYVTRFVVEAYIMAYLTDKDIKYYNLSKKMLGFLESNIHESDRWEMNGALRGAYNLKDNNWDSYLCFDDPNYVGEEYGANNIYSGWTNAPASNSMFDFNKIVNPAETGYIMYAPRTSRFINFAVSVKTDIPKVLYQDSACTIQQTLNDLVQGNISTKLCYIKNPGMEDMEFRLTTPDKYKSIVSYSWDGTNFYNPLGWTTVPPGSKAVTVRFDLTGYNDLGSDFTINIDTRQVV